MRFPPSFLDEIRDRVPISTLIGTRVSFDRKKSNPPKGDFWGCCPFHGEKTPSFHCEDRKGRYHCFGCGVTGDHFKFLTDLEGASFPEAVERVADMAGVPMPARDPEMEKREAQRATLYDVMELAAQFLKASCKVRRARRRAPICVIAAFRAQRNRHSVSAMVRNHATRSRSFWQAKAFQKTRSKPAVLSFMARVSLFPMIASAIVSCFLLRTCADASSLLGASTFC